MQVYNDWEMIIVDDNPKGSKWKEINSMAAANNSDSKIRWIISEDNEGANAARNKGIRNAQGQYLAFLDSDDEWDPEYLNRVADIFLKKNADIVSSRYRVKNRKGIYYSKRFKREGNLYNQLIYQDVVGPTSAVAVRKEIIVRAGMFDEKLPARQDYDMWIRMSKLGASVYYNNEPSLTIYRIEDSISTRGLNHVRGTEMVLEKLLSDPDLAQKKRKIQYYQYYRCGNAASRLENHELAKDYYKKALVAKFSISVLCRYILSCNPLFYNIAFRANEKFKLLKSKLKKGVYY